MKKKSRGIFCLVLSALLFLSACGAEKSAPGEDWLTQLDKLAVEIIIENSELYGSMVANSSSEVSIDKIHKGSFSQKDVNEIFVDCRLLNLPHMGGLDSRIGIVLNADTLEMIAVREFVGDEVMISCLPNADGQSRILALRGIVSMGFRSVAAELFAVKDGEFVEIPAGEFAELAPIEEHEGAYIYYMMGGNRLAVSWESFPRLRAEQMIMPAELVGIYVWEPYQERFVLDSVAEQPVSEDSGIRNLAKLAVEIVLENTEMTDLDPLSSPLNIVIDQISFGAFSKEKANEIFVVCRVFPTIYAETYDRWAGILLDRDTLQLVAYREFEADGAEIRCLEAENGQKRIKLYVIQDGEWVEIPIDVTEPDDEKSFSEWQRRSSER